MSRQGRCFYSIRVRGCLRARIPASKKRSSHQQLRCGGSGCRETHMSNALRVQEGHARHRGPGVGCRTEGMSNLIVRPAPSTHCARFMLGQDLSEHVVTASSRPLRPAMHGTELKPMHPAFCSRLESCVHDGPRSNQQDGSRRSTSCVLSFYRLVSMMPCSFLDKSDDRISDFFEDGARGGAATIRGRPRRDLDPHDQLVVIGRQRAFFEENSSALSRASARSSACTSPDRKSSGRTTTEVHSPNISLGRRPVCDVTAKDHRGRIVEG